MTKPNDIKDVASLNRDVDALKKNENESESYVDNLRLYTRKQWLVLAGLCYVRFASNASFSLLSPFFTTEVIEWLHYIVRIHK